MIILWKLPGPFPSSFLLSLIVGSGEVLQQTPLAVTGPTPSDVMSPPDSADCSKIFTTSVVPTSGKGESLLQPGNIRNPAIITIAKKPFALFMLSRFDRRPASICIVTQRYTSNLWLYQVLVSYCSLFTRTMNAEGFRHFSGCILAEFLTEKETLCRGNSVRSPAQTLRNPRDLRERHPSQKISRILFNFNIANQNSLYLWKNWFPASCYCAWGPHTLKALKAR